VPLDGMAAAIRYGTLSLSYLDADAFNRFAGLSGTTTPEREVPIGALPRRYYLPIQRWTGQ
jgi:hypothetical protein